MTESVRARVPTGVGKAAADLWRSVTAEYELDLHELALLAELVRVIDRLNKLDVILRREGLIVDGGGAGPKAHPALVEARQLGIAQARLTAALRLPAGDEGDGRPQRRVGVRGVYGMGGGS